MADMHNFIAIMEQRRPSVIHLANSAHPSVVEKNRLVLKSILECVVFCGKQNISFGGHRDDDTYVDIGNQGNFKVLLNLCAKQGNQVLKEHFEKAPQNVQRPSRMS